MIEDAAKELDDVLSDVESTPSREQLAELLGLEAIGRRITRIIAHGRGGKAYVRIDLDNNERIELDPLGAYSSPAKMNFEIAAQIGSRPRLKGTDVQEVGTLIHGLAQRYESVQTADRAWEIASEYLRGAVICDVDMADQASRWRAFKHLEGGAKLLHNTVLRDTNGSRYVRTLWLTEYLRAHCDAGEAASMKDQLERYGWRKAGKEGRIKAKNPAFDQSLVWAFLIVPDGWEDTDPGFVAPKAGDGR